MFFIVSKIVANLLMPLPLIFLALTLAAAVWRRRPRLSSGLLVAGVSALWFLGTDAGAYLLLHPLEAAYEARPALSKVDAIVVLGGSLDMNASDPERFGLNPASDRFLKGLLLARRYPGAYLVFSGGTAEISGRGPREAPALRDLAVKLGIPRDHIIAEDRSRNTHENATESKRELDKLHATSVVLITSAFHMPRAMACFEAVGLHPIPYASDFRVHRPAGLGSLIPQPQRLADCTSAIREYVGTLTYRLNGYIGAPARR